MLIDRGNYDNPTGYLSHNSYFFESRATTPISASDTSPSQIATEDLAQAVSSFLAMGSVKVALSLQDEGDEETLWALWHRISDRASQANDALSVICHQRATDESTGAEDKKRYKEWTKGLHASIREHLTYGMPSPSTGRVMAVLGYDECHRRLLGGT